VRRTRPWETEALESEEHASRSVAITWKNRCYAPDLVGLRTAWCAVWTRRRWHSRAREMARSGLLSASDGSNQRVERGTPVAVVALVQPGRVEEYRLQPRAPGAH